MDSEKQTVNCDNDDTNAHFWSKWCHQGCSVWCKKYFWEGQLQRGSADNRRKSTVVSTFPSDLQKTIKLSPTQRKLLAFMVPAIVVHFCWWAFMIKQDNWYLFQDKYPMTITMLFASAIAGQLKRGATDAGFEEIIEVGGPFSGLTESRRKMIAWLLPAAIFHFAFWAILIKKNLFYVFQDKYPMTITMLFGGMVAGMTSEAGGSVAFPIMTLVLNEPPFVARDMSMMLQSCGMSCAAFSIFFMKVHIELHALVFGLMGSSVGVIFGLEVIDPILTPAMKKMGFVSIWFSFAFALFLLNRNYKRRTFNNIPELTWWKRLILFLVGFCGGIFTSFSGSGADICSFSFLTLFFRVSEKVATPTSVVLMATTSLVGWFWRGMIINGITTDGWEYLLVVLPCVTFMAPFGAMLGSHFHRLVLATFVYITDTIALIGGFVIVPQTPVLAGTSVGIIFSGFIFFYLLCRAGQMMLENYEKRHACDSNIYNAPNGIKPTLQSSGLQQV